MRSLLPPGSFDSLVRCSLSISALAVRRRGERDNGRGGIPITASSTSTQIEAFRADLNQQVVDGGADEANRAIIAEFRATRGNVGGVFAGTPLLLLTTTGAKSGAPRTTPVCYTRDGDRYVVLASRAGAPTNPAWYHNLLAHPRATVELGGECFAAASSVVTGEERERLFAAQAALLPFFAEYQQRTSRRIPVVVLEREA